MAKTAHQGYADIMRSVEALVKDHSTSTALAHTPHRPHR